MTGSIPVAWAQKGCEVACSKELEDALNALPTTDPLPCIPLYRTPPPAVDVSKLRGLATEMREEGSEMAYAFARKLVLGWSDELEAAINASEAT